MAAQDPAIRPRELLYPSNLLTLLRLGLLPFALRAMQRPEDSAKAMLLIGAAMFTDAIDGPIARRRDEVSELGKLLDPIADKLLIDGSAIMLARYREFPWWITIALVLRDLVILGGGVLVFRRSGRIVVAHPVGKATTVALTGAMLCYLADGPRRGQPALYLALVPFVASLVAYMRSFLAAMRDPV